MDVRWQIPTTSSGLEERDKPPLRDKEAALQKLASAGRGHEFFAQILPLLDSLKSYIKRRLKIAYLSLEITTPVYTSDDILDTAILRAYKNYARKPKELTLEQWLYQIANDILENISAAACHGTATQKSRSD